jgi:predicted DNA-binding transcriptional regulator YafY
MEQPKLDRLLRLMKLLTGNNTYSVNELARKFGMTTRSIYRYIETFRDAGFVIKKKGNILRIDKSSPYFKDISQLVHFTEEEAFILKSAIESIDENNLIKQNLKRKLYTVYDYKILAETIFKGKNAQNVNQLVDAIENRQKVMLHQYNSAHSHKVSDRIVEPFAFTTNYIQIWAYDVSKQENRLFKVSRIGEVEVLDEGWSFEAGHKAGFIDCFRISSHDLIPVKLNLGMRAAQLLTEEYPLAEKDLVKISDNHWIFETRVCSYEGIGRFVMGLLQDVEIVKPVGFALFVKERLEKSLRENFQNYRNE